MIEEFKICGKCKKKRLLSEFAKDNSRADGLQCYCKKCNEIYRGKHKNNIKKRAKLYYKKHRIKAMAFSRKHYQTHKNEIKSSNKIYSQNHRTERREYVNNSRKSNIGHRINHIMGTAIWRSSKTGKNGKPWTKCVGYNVKELIEHLKTTLPVDYIWDDYINGTDLHIDHKIPIAAFNITSIECTDFKRCWALSNLQLLPSIDNMSKGAKLEKPFQPSLTGF